MNSLIAELTALSEVVRRLLIEVADNATGGEKENYLKPFLENGLRSFDAGDWSHVPEEQRDAFREEVKARFTNIVMSAANK